MSMNERTSAAPLAAAWKCADDEAIVLSVEASALPNATVWITTFLMLLSVCLAEYASELSVQPSDMNTTMGVRSEC